MNEQLVVSDRSRGEMSMTHFHVLCYSQQSKTLAFNLCSPVVVEVLFSPTHFRITNLLQLA